VAWCGHGSHLRCRQVVAVMVVASLSSLPPSRLSSCPITVVIAVVWCKYSRTVFEALLKEICGIDSEELNLDNVLSEHLCFCLA
jgi:hypothetical protein